MKLSSMRRRRALSPTGTTGNARVDRRTRALVRRLRPGDIAVIDHVDIDRESAVALVEARVGAVVNVAPSVSGRYPNLGPEVLLQAGVPIVDNVDPEVFNLITDGDVIRVDGADIFSGDECVATGVAQDADSVAAALVAAKDGIATQLDAFSANAMEHLRRERALLLDGEGVPATATTFRDRHALVVRRAFDYRSDLASIKTYIRENTPVLVGVDAGADALLEVGYRPDLIITDLEDVSDRALCCGAEVVLHSASGDHAGRDDRLDRLGVRASPFVTSGTSEDAAILLAHAHGARLIVLAGSHASLAEFLDIGRSGMASSFLSRAAVGSTLVDARAVAQLYHHRVRGWLVFLLVVLGIALVAAAILTTPLGQDWLDQVQSWLHQGYTSVQGWAGQVRGAVG
jgi:uncharacterized membrane-anchored protein